LVQPPAVAGGVIHRRRIKKSPEFATCSDWANEPVVLSQWPTGFWQNLNSWNY
jgi:hypothetical protein